MKLFMKDYGKENVFEKREQEQQKCKMQPRHMFKDKTKSLKHKKK